ncbi:hypothetical protein FCE95_05465 [Luteimonas gilva]|uniref:Uncharacterized protein n=1 Tax=Luteimonas gilva TaxID=2572684 RepID=A0A4U5JY47_9GAMM|nr:hypothetical protein [Luteimonas gilva]TKR33728.1 hypothetical protein FCE95_05465 [Luteimonas gilva]
MDHVTAVKLQRWLVATAAIFAILVLADKFGLGFRPLRLGSVASWQDVGKNLLSHFALSIFAGSLFFFFGRNSSKEG